MPGESGSVSQQILAIDEELSRLDACSAALRTRRHRLVWGEAGRAEIQAPVIVQQIDRQPTGLTSAT